MSFKETQEACKKLSEMSTLKLLSTEALFDYLNKYIEGLKSTSGEDIIPHMVLSHGFMQWSWLLGSQFPCLSWRNEGVENLGYDEFERFFYDRFFLRVADLPSLQDMNEDKKKELKEEGWRAYLDD